jgi:hypothetical protein
MKLSDHFELQEFTKTSYTEFQTAQDEEVKPYISTLKMLCLYILEPVRLFYGKPVVISSGFRGKTLNAKIGGVANSQHCSGQAADFTVKGIPNEDIIKDINNGKLSIYFGQCIHETINGKDWIHISLGYPYRLDKPNMQMLKTSDGKNYTAV